jgi:hypothetical protein
MAEAAVTPEAIAASRMVANDPDWRNPIPSRVGRIAELNSRLNRALDRVEELEAALQEARIIYLRTGFDYRASLDEIVVIIDRALGETGEEEGYCEVCDGPCQGH